VTVAGFVVLLLHNSAICVFALQHRKMDVEDEIKTTNNFCHAQNGPIAGIMKKSTVIKERQDNFSLLFTSQRISQTDVTTSRSAWPI